MGSVSIAFILLFLLGKLIIQTGDFSWIILLSVYGVDSVLTIFHRLMLHENIGLPHRKHLYQLMANELRIPHVVVSVIYMVLQFLIVAGLLWLPVDHWVYFYGYWWFSRNLHYLYVQILSFARDLLETTKYNKVIFGI